MMSKKSRPEGRFFDVFFRCTQTGNFVPGGRNGCEGECG